MPNQPTDDQPRDRRSKDRQPPSRGPVCQGIVPPYLVDRLAERAGGEHQRALRTTAGLDLALRAARVAARASAAPAGEPASPATGEPAPRRTISDTHSSTTLPGDVVRAEGGEPAGDPAADEAYDGLGATWSLYQEVYGRDSLDGAGLPLDATVHYGDRYDNAFWDGERMVFGDGDGLTFRRFTISVDVIGHELTHGVTQLSGGLTYQGQSGALNESLSDVFGSLVKQRALGQDAAGADWLIGAGLFTDAVRGVALRSMKAPGTAYDDPDLGKDPQPATMADYVETTSDNGGVHINSGIPNHAFYLAAVAVGGPAWDGVGRVWYDVLTGGSLSPDVDFAGFAAATLAAASARYGDGSTAAVAVADAWQQVGVTPGAPPTEPGQAQAPTDPVDPSRVVVHRSGGLTGQQVRREVNVQDLPDEERDAWIGLLGSPLLGSLETEPSQPDRYVYRVSGPAGVDVTVAEHQLPADVRALLDRTLRR
jgi:Thermolysin metallopeptidase, alpha-helical domain/Thermolysin metallopeptidase, catalytic domain